MITPLRKTGNLGEDIACKFLINKGFLIVERNVLRKWGEIDIVASKTGVLHFIEVKTVKRLVRYSDEYRAEDNIHAAKLARLRRVISTYLLSLKEDPDWQFDIITVHLNDESRKAKIALLEDIVL